MGLIIKYITLFEHTQSKLRWIRYKTRRHYLPLIGKSSHKKQWLEDQRRWKAKRKLIMQKCKLLMILRYWYIMDRVINLNMERMSSSRIKQSLMSRAYLLEL